ncbi:MAG TPA: divergent polysaccharide deacetylase family protein [Candidatus Eremiobacteraceae bacterium]|nr:divergent polysaccharide deacetylase family protein [Candidatus Eremiobacteraceae bacterium]
MLFVFAVILAGAWWQRHKIIAFFTPHRAPARHVAVAPSEEPSVAATVPAAPPSPSASVSPSVTPSPSASGPPRVAIIIDDCGYSMTRDQVFLSLPIPVTLSILPITPHGREIAAAATAAGKYAIVHLPMEPESSAANPGPGAILTGMTDDQVRALVASDLDALPPLPGANNHMGSKASADKRVMTDVLSVLKERNMFFIDSMTSVASVGGQTARDLAVPTAERAVFLDNQATVPYVEGQLRETIARAKADGSAIAIGHPNPQTDEALIAMIPQMQAAGIVFVPAQTLVH